MPKVLILILSTTDQRYKEFIRACNLTWVQRAEQHSIHCIFYQGGASNDILELNELQLAVDDTLDSTGFKLFRAFNYIEKSGIEYDYIYRTNLSSYIFIDKFINYANAITNEDLYAGVIVKADLNHRWPYRFMCKLAELYHPENTIPFASGAGFWISRKNVERVLSDRKLDFRLADDSMVGECLHRHGIKITPVSRIDFNGDSICYLTDASGTMKQIEHCFHIRCRSKDRARDAARIYELNECSNYADFSNLLIT
jgi:hypothetical protein